MAHNNDGKESLDLNWYDDDDDDAHSRRIRRRKSTIINKLENI